MRTPPLILVPLVTMLTGCWGGFSDPPPPIESIHVSCPSCTADSIGVIEFHQPGSTQSLTLDSNGSGSVQPTQGANYIQGMWFSFQGFPLAAESATRAEASWNVTLRRIAPDSSLTGDSLVVIRFDDSLPQPYHWTTRVHGQFSYPFNLDTVLLPDSNRTASFRIPRLVFNDRRLGFETSHLIRYRDVWAYGYEPAPLSFLNPSWPPKTLPFSPSVGQASYTQCWSDSLSGARLRTTCLEHPDSTGFRFHRAMSRAGTRIIEDSGHWDRATGIAHFHRRTLNAMPHRDSSLFLPLQIKQNPNQWWFSAIPATEYAATQTTSWGIEWRFFAPPDQP